ncbi:MAG: hypothetical protein K2M64_02885, partial [Clostridia bacterium]|nr:hypothetical protein [Clostridia bacterium]
VACGVESALVRVSKLLTELGYESILENRDFSEIFAKNDNFEVTVSFIALPNSGCRIGVAVFSPGGKRSKKALIGLMAEISKAFTNERI